MQALTPNPIVKRTVMNAEGEVEQPQAAVEAQFWKVGNLHWHIYLLPFSRFPPPAKKRRDC